MTEQERHLCELACWAAEAKRRPAGNTRVPETLIREFILYKWTARNGADVGCRYWSDAALIYYAAHGLYAANSRKRALRHEHVIPRTYLMPGLLTLVTVEQVFEYLNIFCFGCIMTLAEEKSISSKLRSSMPAGWDGIDVWTRYRHAFAACGISIWEVDERLHRLRTCY